MSTVLLALGAHVLGGGDVPTTTVLVPLAAVTLAATVPFSGRRIGVPGAVALLGAGQLGLHQSFDSLAGAMGCAPAADMGSHAHAVQVACTASSQHAVGPSDGVPMLVLHVVATLVTATLIAGIDRALSWIGTWMRPLVALLAPVALPASAVLRVRDATVHRAVGRRDLGVLPLRGPPTSPAHVALAA